VKVVLRGAPQAVLDERRRLGLDHGAVASEVLGIRLRAAGGRVEITWDGGSAEV